MPIYEFYCRDCHRIYNFLSRAVDTTRQPACPRCGRPDLERRASAFAISKGRKEEPDGDAMPDIDEARLEKAMASLAGELDGLNEDDPRQAANLMRKLYGAAGLPIGQGMAEALQRMEAGEDPEQIEADLGDALEEDPFAGAGTGEKRLRTLRRRFLPPSVDTELHEL